MLAFPGSGEIKNLPNPSKNSHGTEGYPRCHPNCPMEIPTGPLKVPLYRAHPSAHHRKLREWKGPRFHRFAPTTGSLSKHRSRSSHHCLPLLLTETTHIGCFNTSTIIVSAGKVKGQGIICRKNIILLSESDSLVFHIFHRIVHKFQWITLWKEWKTTLIFPKTTHFVSDRFPGKSKTAPWWKDLSHSTGHC